MSKDSLARYYRKNREKIQKKFRGRVKNLGEGWLFLESKRKFGYIKNLGTIGFSGKL